jgi:GntR family transcriptional regulator
MSWEFKSDRPIYAQLMEQIELRIVSGMYPPGSKLPSVREMAAEAAVNPNTMQKALSELERKGLLYTQRTAGRFITEDEAMIAQTKQGMAQELIHEFMEKMQSLGYSQPETVQLLTAITKEES